MRIISGKHKGRTINAPKNLPVRPTTDFAKESIFNILNNNFDYSELKVLDLFSGTGSIAYEFSSRGSNDITAIDSNFNCYSFIKKTVDAFDLKNVKVIKSDVFSYIKHCKESFDLIFADPPYELDTIETIPSLIFENKLLAEGGWLIVEHSEKTDFSKQEHFLEKRKYGNVNFSIFDEA